VSGSDQGFGPGERSAIAAAIRGDADAVREIWVQNRRWVAAVILAHKPREADLEDLLQEVAMSFVKTIGTLRDEGTLRPWLRTVAINTARASGRDARRRRRGIPWRLGAEHTREVEPGAELAHERGPEPAAAKSEHAARIVALAARLPEGYREPLILKAVRGMSYRQIGRVMGLPETTIETRIARGRKMLRELVLAEEGAGEAVQSGAIAQGGPA
jgi:RNA polymerase sigma-70 factor (ECF subfamily)